MSSGPSRVREGWAARPKPAFGLTDAPHRLVPPMAPHPQLFAKLLGNAFAIAVVGFAIAISLGKIFALRHGYRVYSNQVWGMGCGTQRGQGSPDPRPWEGVGGWSTRRETGKEPTDVLGPHGRHGTVAESLWAVKWAWRWGCVGLDTVTPHR